MKSKVSICVPTFNRKDYLKHALHSVYAQTYKEYEVIVVDDGSTDNSREQLKRLGVKTVFLGKNMGRGYAIKQARPKHDKVILV